MVIISSLMVSIAYLLVIVMSKLPDSTITERVSNSRSGLVRKRKLSASEYIVYCISPDYFFRPSYMRWNPRRPHVVPVVRKRSDGSVIMRQFNLLVPKTWSVLVPKREYEPGTVGYWLSHKDEILRKFEELGTIAAATFTSKASGGWDQEGQTTWNEAGHPGAGDEVTINAGHEIYLESNTTCAKLTVDAGGTLLTYNYDLTVSNATTVSGTLTCNSGTCSFGSGITSSWGLLINSGGTFNGGSGTHTMGSLGVSSGATCILSSGTTTINGYNVVSGYNYVISISGTRTNWSHSNGTTTILNSGANNGVFQFNYSTDGFYNLTIEYSTQTIRPANPYSANSIYVYGALTITSGTLNTRNPSSTDKNLTVMGNTTVSGTLTCNTSTCSFGSGVTGSTQAALYVTGTFNGGSGTHTMGSLATIGITNMSTGTTTINGRYTLSGAQFQLVVGSASTWSASSSTIIFVAAGVDAHLQLNKDISIGAIEIQYGSYTLANSNNFYDRNLTLTTLTITNGTFDTKGSLAKVINLTVTGNTTITGTLTCNSSTISLGASYSSNYALILNSGGAFNGGTGTHTIGSICHVSGTATITLTTGTTTISRAYNNISLYTCAGTTLTCPSGSTLVFGYNGTMYLADADKTDRTFANVQINGGSSCLVRPSSASTEYNITAASVSISNSSQLSLLYPGGTVGRNLTVNGNVSITGTNSTLYNNSSSTITISGNVSVGAGSYFGTSTTSTATVSISGTTSISGMMVWGVGNCTFNSTVTVNAGGALYVSSGTTTIGTELTNNGTMYIYKNSYIVGSGSQKTITTYNGRIYHYGRVYASNVKVIGPVPYGYWNTRGSCDVFQEVGSRR